jgi:hypothetical protein
MRDENPGHALLQAKRTPGKPMEFDPVEAGTARKAQASLRGVRCLKLTLLMTDGSARLTNGPDAAP